MKKIFVSSKLRGDMLTNMDWARSYCRLVVDDHGFIPIAPHIFFTQFMDDNIEEHRILALEFCKKLVEDCDEIWVIIRSEFVDDDNDGISDGMRVEIEHALKFDKPVFYVYHNAEGVITATTHPDIEVETEEDEVA